MPESWNTMESRMNKKTVSTLGKIKRSQKFVYSCTLPFMSSGLWNTPRFGPMTLFALLLLYSFCFCGPWQIGLCWIPKLKAILLAMGNSPFIYSRLFSDQNLHKTFYMLPLCSQDFPSANSIGFFPMVSPVINGVYGAFPAGPFPSKSWSPSAWKDVLSASQPGEVERKRDECSLT